MRGLRRLCVFLPLFLAFPALTKAQYNQSTSLAFGQVFSAPVGGSACCFYNPTYDHYHLTSTQSSGPFSYTGPSYIGAGQTTIYASVSFAPSSAGTYSGSVVGTYTSVEGGPQLILTVYVSGHYFAPGHINPKYRIMGVWYAPPGSQSNACYGSDTVVGNSTSVSSSFSNSVTKSVSVSFGGLFNLKGTSSSTYTQEQDTSETVAVSQTTSNSQCLNGFSDSTKGLNHDWDYVFVWLNPIVNFGIDPSTNTIVWTGYAWDQNDPTYPDMDVFGIPVGCLNGDFQTTQPAEWTTCQSYFAGPSGPLARSWAQNNTDGSGPGLTGFGSPCPPPPGTTTDVCTILAADQFGSSSFTFTPPPGGSNTTPDGRFTACSNSHCNTVLDYEVNITNNYMQGYSTTTTQSQTSIYKYSTTYSVDATIKGTSWLASFQANLNSSNTMTWTNQFSQSTNNSQGQMSSFKIVGPSPGYTGPSRFVVYQDNLYGTFMFNAQ